MMRAKEKVLMFSESDGPVSGEAIQRAGSDVVNLFMSGGTLGSLQHYTPPDYESVYKLGHQFYARGAYNDAFKAFGFLVLNNHLDRRFLFAFAAACQMLKRYEEAIRYYTLAMILDAEDPLPSLHISECLIGLGMLPEAIEMLRMVIDECGSEHEVIRRRAAALRELLGSAGSERKGIE